ncbi:MAG: hypothetical protein AB4352_17365 [Hormoscilla sp.]
MLQATEHCYIVKDSEIISGEPIIKGTRSTGDRPIGLWQEREYL